MSENSAERERAGMFYGLIAYLWWGVMPLYFSYLTHIPAFELLAHRILWSVLWVGTLITIQGRWDRVWSAITHRRTLVLLLISTVLIAINWVTFLYGVIQHRVLETSMGYFITPLFSVAMGILVFRERLRPWQWVALTFASIGVGVLLLTADRPPWIALTLMLSFGCYGMVRKQVAVDGVTGLFVETILLVPLCIGYLGYLESHGERMFGNSTTLADVMLILSGGMTAVPLICFAQAVVRLRLSTIGFLQYISPSMQFVVALVILHETFTTAHQWSFSLIWLGLIVFLYDAVNRPK